MINVWMGSFPFVQVHCFQCLNGNFDSLKFQKNGTTFLKYRSSNSLFSLSTDWISCYERSQKISTGGTTFFRSPNEFVSCIRTLTVILPHNMFLVFIHLPILTYVSPWENAWFPQNSVSWKLSSCNEECVKESHLFVRIVASKFW